MENILPPSKSSRGRAGKKRITFPRRELPPSFWDHASTPKIILIKHKYEQAGYMGWTNEKVLRLCQSTGWTLFELCAWAGEFRRTRINYFWRFDKWPATLGIHFAHIDAQYSRHVFKTPPKPHATTLAAIDLLKEYSHG